METSKGDGTASPKCAASPVSCSRIPFPSHWSCLFLPTDSLDTALVRCLQVCLNQSLFLESDYCLWAGSQEHNPMPWLPSLERCP